MVGAADGDSIWMVHAVEAKEHGAQSVLLWLQLLLAHKNFAVDLEVFVLGRVDIVHLERSCKHLDRLRLRIGQLIQNKWSEVLLDRLYSSAAGDVYYCWRSCNTLGNRSVSATARCRSSLL